VTHPVTPVVSAETPMPQAHTPAQRRASLTLSLMVVVQFCVSVIMSGWSLNHHGITKAFGPIVVGWIVFVLYMALIMSAFQEEVPKMRKTWSLVGLVFAAACATVFIALGIGAIMHGPHA
jgi:cytochrome c biogenesis protein CcdA